MSVPRRLRPLAVVAYAAFVGLLLASYITPLQDILQSKADISALERKVQNAEQHNAVQERLVRELNTPAGIERAARERYGIEKPGEKVYMVRLQVSGSPPPTGDPLTGTRAGRCPLLSLPVRSRHSETRGLRLAP